MDFLKELQDAMKKNRHHDVDMRALISDIRKSVESNLIDKVSLFVKNIDMSVGELTGLDVIPFHGHLKYPNVVGAVEFILKQHDLRWDRLDDRPDCFYRLRGWDSPINANDGVLVRRIKHVYQNNDPTNVSGALIQAIRSLLQEQCSKAASIGEFSTIVVIPHSILRIIPTFPEAKYIVENIVHEFAKEFDLEDDDLYTDRNYKLNPDFQCTLSWFDYDEKAE
jgi:hypothetical protein